MFLGEGKGRLGLWSVPNIFSFGRYVAFDFHKECKNMRWDRLSLLLDQVADMQDELR